MTRPAARVLPGIVLTALLAGAGCAALMDCYKCDFCPYERDSHDHSSSTTRL